jgi:hypothetical protein
MPVSYMLDTDQLSVLARYLELDGFPGLPELPAPDEKRSGELLEKLAGLGMVHLRGTEASVDLGLAFILSAAAKPELLARAGNTLCCCTKKLGVIISPDAHAKNRYRITPLPNSAELSERIWEAAGPGGDIRDFSLWDAASGWKPVRLSKAETDKHIAEIYTEVPEK